MWNIRNKTFFLYRELHYNRQWRGCRVSAYPEYSLFDPEISTFLPGKYTLYSKGLHIQKRFS